MITDTDITRFIKAQQLVYHQVMQELKSGKKKSHWMWYIFPQVAGLGFSDMSKYYSVKSMEEAKEYAMHPLLGARLQECCLALLSIENKTAHDIFGSPDDAKLLSCLTLFSFAMPDIKVFSDVLKKYFADKRDEKTIGLLQQV